MDKLVQIFNIPQHLQNHSELSILIERACLNTLNEPDLSLNLEIADYINNKKQNLAYEVCETLLLYINGYRENSSLLALELLNLLIINCGYMFIIQINRKEFLNELVKRFPQSPTSTNLTKVMKKTLKFIKLWKMGLCSQTQMKNDTMKIENMYNLLASKGYKFPSVDPEEISVYFDNAASTFKLAEELESSEKEKLSIKLQELLRRANPKDLDEANRIMKQLTGYEIEQRKDYDKIMLDSVADVEGKIEQLNELLNNHTEGHYNRVIQSLYNECISAQSKIQQYLFNNKTNNNNCQELLEINDQINDTKKRYESEKYGVAAQNSQKNSQSNNGKISNHEINLIDFD